MVKKIDDIKFWKKRIDTAQTLHYSVYVANDFLWETINNSHRDILHRIISRNSKVLDAGCGYGRWSNRFNNYIGVDFSPDFIKIAKEKYPNKTFIQANLKELPFKDEEFDWAFCVSMKKMVIDNMGEEEWKLMEKELLRVAKNLLVLEYEDWESYEVI